MKELIAFGGNLRALFAFDPKRQALILLGGDKTDDWEGWYERSVPLADDLYDDFLGKFTKKVLEKADGLAPLSSVAAAERLDDQVKRAVADGATLTSEGERKGAFFPPGVLTGVSPDSPSYKEELFGPVATVYKVSSEEQAVELANDTPFGLGSYVFTTDDEQARRVADGIEAGMVFVNAVGAEGVELPFGGVKQSGFGREGGAEGIHEYLEVKYVAMNL